MEHDCPKGEIPWVTYCEDGKCKYLITSKPSREFYYLYSINDDGSLKKICKDRSPMTLEERIRSKK